MARTLPVSLVLLVLQLFMMSTFEALTRACAAEPRRDRMTFLHEDGKIEVATGEQLLARSAQVSEGLRRIATPGDRVLLAYPAGIDFVVGFLGCLHAGMIPVPVSLPEATTTVITVRSHCIGFRSDLSVDVHIDVGTNRSADTFGEPRMSNSVALRTHARKNAVRESARPLKPNLGAAMTWCSCNTLPDRPAIRRVS